MVVAVGKDLKPRTRQGAAVPNVQRLTPEWQHQRFPDDRRIERTALTAAPAQDRESGVLGWEGPGWAGPGQTKPRPC